MSLQWRLFIFHKSYVNIGNSEDQVIFYEKKGLEGCD
jgi:hypothetical protein